MGRRGTREKRGTGERLNGEREGGADGEEKRKWVCMCPTVLLGVDEKTKARSETRIQEGKENMNPWWKMCG
jgi:hypothetical protein